MDGDPDLNQKWTSLIPIGKMGWPEDLMGAVTFLFSDASGYVTGADLRGRWALYCYIDCWLIVRPCAGVPGQRGAPMIHRIGSTVVQLSQPGSRAGWERDWRRSYIWTAMSAYLIFETWQSRHRYLHALHVDMGVGLPWKGSSISIRQGGSFALLSPTDAHVSNLG